MKSTFSINVSQHENNPVVAMTGEVDMHSCAILNDTLEGIVGTATSDLILNLTDIQYLDSSGLGAIAYSAKLLADKNHDIIIICNKPHIKKIFEISGLSQKNIRLFENFQEAYQLL